MGQQVFLHDLLDLGTVAQIEQVVQEYLLTHPDIMVQMSNRLNSQQVAAEEKERSDALFQVGPQALLDPKVAFVSGPRMPTSLLPSSSITAVHIARLRWARSRI